MSTATTALRRATTRAAVWRGGDDVVLESVPLPEPARGEVLVRVLLATVCGSDRHTVSGRRRQPCPSILGHETVGEVVALGADPGSAVGGEPLALGRRVIWSVTLPCGACDRCRAGITAKCRTVLKAGHEAVDSAWPLSGGYAEHVLLPRGLPVAVVGDDVPDALAAPAACATATVMAVMERAGDPAGRRVTVLGAGMLGLTAIAAAAAGDAATVVAVEPDPARAALARRFGAAEVRPSTADLAACDLLLEFSGSSAALDDGVRALDVAGVAVLAGSVAPDAAVALDPETVVRRHLSLRGVHNYEPRHLVEALAFLQRTGDRFPWSELVGDPVPLDDVRELLTATRTDRPRDAVSPVLR